MSDGRYRKVRPDTEVIPGLSNVDERNHLYAWDYDLIMQEVPQGQRQLPDGTVC